MNTSKKQTNGTDEQKDMDSDATSPRDDPTSDVHPLRALRRLSREEIADALRTAAKMVPVRAAREGDHLVNYLNMQHGAVAQAPTDRHAWRIIEDAFETDQASAIMEAELRNRLFLRERSLRILKVSIEDIIACAAR